MQPDEFAEECTGMIKDTGASVLEGKHLRKTIPSYTVLETYEGTPIFIPVEITEEAGELVAH